MAFALVFFGIGKVASRICILDGKSIIRVLSYMDLQFDHTKLSSHSPSFSMTLKWQETMRRANLED